jgi:hypothetical protein
METYCGSPEPPGNGLVAVDLPMGLFILTPEKKMSRRRDIRDLSEI